LGSASKPVVSRAEKILIARESEVRTEVEKIRPRLKAYGAAAACLISAYLFLEDPARLAVCDKIAAALYRPDLEDALEKLYRFWLSLEADVKKKMILAPSCIYGSDAFILSRKKQIEDWAKNSRGALAAFAVYCIALNGGSAALLMLDGWRRKAPSGRVKTTAADAFSFASEELGISPDELSDRIVPDFGFDKRGEKNLCGKSPHAPFRPGSGLGHLRRFGFGPRPPPEGKFPLHGGRQFYHCRRGRI
jgi:hypothetical protein